MGCRGWLVYSGLTRHRILESFFAKLSCLVGSGGKGGAHTSNWVNLLTSSALPAQFLAPGYIKGEGQGRQQKTGSCCQQLSAH